MSKKHVKEVNLNQFTGILFNVVTSNFPTERQYGVVEKAQVWKTAYLDLSTNSATAHLCIHGKITLTR